MTPTLRRAALMAPGLGWLALFLLVPCLLVLGLSFFERGVYGGIDYIFTFENYRRAVNPLYRSILLNSAWIAFLATLVSALIGYPAAYAIVKAPAHRQSALLVLVMLPFWSNYLIRTYAWMVLLNREGLINRALAGLGATEPLPLLYNDFAIVLGLVYGYLPFMVLAIYASLSRLDPALLEQSADLGASPVSTFLRITLPLTLPGVAAGSAFVFVLSIGNFITPDLLGGGRRVMVGNLIYKQFLAARDWPFGSALAFLLIAIMMLLLFAQALIVRRTGGERRA
ncbi:MAG TPA: ABC transporter permease [Alphaproteobacteria bacterium]